MTVLRKRVPLFALLLLLIPSLASAQAGVDLSEATLPDSADSGDTAWLLATGLLALAAIVPGLALFHAGRVRREASLAIVTDIATIAMIVPLVWIIAGYTVAFGSVTRGWIGAGNAWMLIELGNIRAGTSVPESAFALFQLGFAVLAAALVTGAWPERGRLGWLAGFAALWSLMVYAPQAHWIWGGGWLASRLGTVDFAGSLVVHCSAGVSALAVTLLIGRRIGFPLEARPGPHAPALALAGAALLWVGMLALAGGAALTASDDSAAALIACEAAASSGALFWLLADRLLTGRSQPLALARGALAGLAAVSGAAGAIGPGAAVLFGVVGVAAGIGGRALLRRLVIDDSLDTVAIHAFGGLVGALLTAPFLAHSLGGTGYAAGMTAPRQMVAQAIAALVVIAWSAIGSTIAALMVSMVTPMRISEADEAAGIDHSRHGGEPES